MNPFFYVFRKIDFYKRYTEQKRSAKKGIMIAEAIFYTIMFVVFVGFAIAMHYIRRNEDNIHR
jgi:hypothetical protein